MADRILNSQIIIRNDTAANWAISTLILAKSEMALDTSNNILKIGDGVNVWNDLPEANSAYIHPSYEPRASDLYKITVDNTGHVTAVEVITSLTLGSYTISYNSVNDTLDVVYVP